MLMDVIILFLGAFMVAGAFLAVYLKNLTSAVIASGVISLMASVAYLVMAAPDVAMTEAAIGSGLTTVVFLYALSRMRHRKKEDK